MMISGVFFLPGALPTPFRDYVFYNPLVHIIMWFRQGVYPEYRADGLDKTYALDFSVICVVIGLILLTISMREIREERP